LIEEGEPENPLKKRGRVNRRRGEKERKKVGEVEAKHQKDGRFELYVHRRKDVQQEREVKPNSIFV